MASEVSGAKTVSQVASGTRAIKGRRVTGLGTGAPDLADEPGNLTALHFVPLGNTAFMATDPHTLVLYGEPNALVMDKTGASKELFTSSGITLSFGGHTLTLDVNGFSIDERSYANH